MPLHHLLIGTGALAALIVAASVTPHGRRLLGRLARFANALRQDTRIPRALRWTVFALMVVPIPGELDELAAAAILAAMWLHPVYRAVLRTTWAATANPAAA
jgi:hypothetical protein